MIPKKWLIIIGVLLLLFFVVSRPDQAANTFQNVASTLGGWGDSVITFLTALTG